MRLLILLITLMLQITAHAQPEKQSLESIQNLAKSYLIQKLGNISYGRVSVEPGKLDPRLRLSYCHPKLLHAYLPKGSQASTTHLIGIRCESSKPWSIFMPVKIHVYAKAYVAKHPLRRGIRLSEENLSLKEIDVSLLKNGYYQELKLLRGKIVKTPLSAGTAISPHDITTEKIIRRGDSVLISASIHGVKVTMQGVALSSGGLGDTIRILSNSSKREIQAQVTGIKQVEVLL